MAEQYIPAGRTAVVKKEGTEYQVQTEYARHPHPRITTTIFAKGQVLHKIERPLDSEITSLEGMHQAEDIIKSQHREVAQIIREKGLAGHAEQRARRSEDKIRSTAIARLPDVERVYLVTKDGKLCGDKELAREFKKMFKHILKGLPELLKVFTMLPGSGDLTEEGLFEIEPGRLMLASTGAEFLLILLRPGTDYGEISSRIREIISGK